MTHDGTNHHADTYQLPPDRAAGLARGLLIAAAATGIVSLIGLAAGPPRQFLFSYLTAFVFVLSVTLGALFWVILHHLAGAGWSVVVRRLQENMTRALPWMALLFLPVLFGVLSIYSWTSAPDAAADPHGHALWQGKTWWLNLPFFVARAVVYFVVWAWVAWSFFRPSAEQDASGDVGLTKRMQWFSPPAMFLLALTSTLAAVDWLMTLDWKWYSTIFGVYFWAGAVLSSMACLTLIVLGLRAAGYLANTITLEHQHDLGKWLFGFVVFWAYIAFAQYFLIYCGNIPEETRFFVHRLEGSWLWLSVALPVGQFVVPFVLLLSRTAKRTTPILATGAAIILVFHYVDMYWLVMPNLHTEGMSPHWLDLTTLVALTSAAALVVVQALRTHALIPVRDPRLAESLRFQNV